MELSQERFDSICRQAKVTLFKKLSETTETFVLINLEHEGVRVPDRLRQPGPSLVLKFSQRYDYKLEVLEEGIEQLLSFGGENFPVFVAWDAIFGMHDGNPNGNVNVWPFHAPEKMRPDAPIPLGNEDRIDALIMPDGQLQEPPVIH